MTPNPTNPTNPLEAAQASGHLIIAPITGPTPPSPPSPSTLYTHRAAQNGAINCESEAESIVRLALSNFNAERNQH